jgi:hypothetical protein
MDILTLLLQSVDTFLITPYRFPENPIAGWWLGSSLLALWCTLLGDLSQALAFRANAFKIQRDERDMVAYHHHSLNALRSGDKGAFKAINRLANEAFGKTFFLQLTLACASLWPVALALGWMQSRFANVDFPLIVTGINVSYPFIFIPLYILTRLLYGKCKAYILKPEKPP